MRVLNKSRLLVHSDRIFYDNVWTEILRREETMGELMRLKELSDQLRIDEAVPTQLLRRLSTISNARSLARRSILSLHALVDIIDNYSGTRVDSLDQLYFQAHCLHPILLDKVKKWAIASSGLFPVRSESEDSDHSRAGVNYIKWTEIERDPSIASRVCWAKVKSVERAIEKIVRTYKHVSTLYFFLLVGIDLNVDLLPQDVSKLIDICRQCIVFETVSDLMDCLVAIAGDDDTSIVRIKNRLDPAYDSALSAGYRDVCVNLRFSNELAESWGIERHVCEVQLVLLPYATLKVES